MTDYMDQREGREESRPAMRAAIAIKREYRPLSDSAEKLAKLIEKEYAPAPSSSPLETMSPPLCEAIIDGLRCGTPLERDMRRDILVCPRCILAESSPKPAESPDMVWVNRAEYNSLRECMIEAADEIQRLRTTASPELQVFKSLSDKVEDGEVSIDELCKPERDERQRERAINLCRELAIPLNGQVLNVIIYALNLWMDWETKHATTSPEPPRQTYVPTAQDERIEQAYAEDREHSRIQHSTIPVQVWADIDKDIAGLVTYLNTLPGLRTHASCQGCEQGPKPYGAYVMAEWTAELEERLSKEFNLEFLGEHWGYVRPRPSWTAPSSHSERHIFKFGECPPDCPDCKLARELLGEPQAETGAERRVHELIAASQQLLEWQPICSKGSSGELRQNRVRSALAALASTPQNESMRECQHGKMLIEPCASCGREPVDVDGEAIVESRTPSSGEAK